MTPAQVVVTLAGAALAVAVNVYFLAPRLVRARRGGARGATLPAAGAGDGALVMPGDRRAPGGDEEMRR